MTTASSRGDDLRLAVIACTSVFVSAIVAGASFDVEKRLPARAQTDRPA